MGAMMAINTAAMITGHPTAPAKPPKAATPLTPTCRAALAKLPAKPAPPRSKNDPKLWAPLPATVASLAAALSP